MSVDTSPTRSSLEDLPRELVWKIVEYAPESVFDLRLASRMLHSRIAEFVAQPVIVPIVEVLKFSQTPQKETHIAMEVAKHMSAIFELRLKFDQPSIFHKRIKRNKRNGADVMIYNYKSQNLYGNEKIMLITYIRKCSGGRIGLANIECAYSIFFTVASKLLKYFHFDKLKCRFEAFPENVVNNLLEAVAFHKINHLTLQVKQVTALQDPVSLLLRLSSLVRALKIEIVPEFDTTTRGNNFLGAANIDWEPVIYDMFSRKLDKLCIDNSPFPAYLPRATVLSLSNNLPHQGKKLWFSATCGTNFVEGPLIINGHVVQIGHSFTGRCYQPWSLRVKHSTREHELFET